MAARRHVREADCTVHHDLEENVNETVITREGLDRLREELDQLTTTGRAEIAERIRFASATEANASESAEYMRVREDQAMLERRIAVLRDRIARAVVVEPDRRNGVLDVGERVQVRDLANDETVEFELVGSLEADPFARRISAASPLGRVLLGRKRGEIAIVDAPKGELRYEILRIRSRAAGRAS
jgi:transcription elongation factor GreA